MSPAARARLTVALAVGLLIVDIATLAFAVVVKNNQDAATNAIRNGLIEGCERNGNPLRKVVREQVRNEIQQSHNTDLYRQFFPQIPPSKLHAAIAAQNAQRRAEIANLAPVDCTAQYH